MLVYASICIFYLIILSTTLLSALLDTGPSVGLQLVKVIFLSMAGSVSLLLRTCPGKGGIWTLAEFHTVLALGEIQLSLFMRS